MAQDGDKKLWAAGAEHVKVYYEPGRFGGWPANHGMWIWGNEVLVGLSRGWYKEMGDRHHIDRDKPEEHALARSLDGGQTWTLEHPNDKGFLIPEGRGLHGTELPGVAIKPWSQLDKPIDFSHPDLAFAMRMQNHLGQKSRFYYSYDRGRHWEGPFQMPDMGLPGIMARTDYVVDSADELFAVITAEKSRGGEGRPFAARITEGGLRWEFVSWIMEEPKGYAIMPSTVRLTDKMLLTAIRERMPNAGRSWISLFRSEDNGTSWNQLPDLADTGVGNPAALVKLDDGRIVAIYGYRATPFSILAKISKDNGDTWTPPITLRDDGNDRDIGYPRVVLRPDGKIVATYYMSDPKTGPERYIGATIWHPNNIEER